MELTIGSAFRKVALELIKEETEEEMKLTINNEEQQKEFDKGNLPLGISFSFNMGWNKNHLTTATIHYQTMLS